MATVDLTPNELAALGRAIFQITHLAPTYIHIPEIEDPDGFVTTRALCPECRFTLLKDLAGPGHGTECGVPHLITARTKFHQAIRELRLAEKKGAAPGEERPKHREGGKE